jgi:hypothetical protein
MKRIYINQVAGVPHGPGIKVDIPSLFGAAAQ